jgi:cell division protein FtsL
MEPIATPALEPKQTQQSSWRKAILYIAVAVVSGLLSGGAVWYFMNQQNSDNKTTLNSQIDTKNKSIATLQGKVVTLEKGSTGSNITDTTTSTTTATNDLESMKAFCAGGVSGIN